MVPVSYLIAVITSQKTVEVTLAILNIAGRGQAFHSFSIGDVTTDLWFIPKGKRNKQEVTTQLQAIPAIRSVSVAALSNPVSGRELTEVRELFTGIGWDANSVTNDDLSVFINAKLQGKYDYYIDYNIRGEVPIKIQIKRIEDHPQFSPNWLRPTEIRQEETLDKEFTIDDIETRSIIHIVEEDEPPPPFPPPLNK